MSRTPSTTAPQLGTFLKEYKGSTSGVAKLLIIAAICLAIATLFFAGAVSEAQSHEFGGVVALSIIGLLFFGIAVFGLYMLFRGRGACLRLYEDGLSFRRAGKESATTWDQIDSYLQEMTCRIVKKDGEVIEFGSGLEGCDEVAQRIREQTLRIMLPRLKAAISSGARVEFRGWKPADQIPLGKGLSHYMEAGSGFSVDADAITEIDTGNQIAWKDLLDFGVSEETLGPRLKMPIQVLHLADAKQQFRTRYGLLANAHVLLMLCDDLGGRRSS